jgi:hypothetical protein
MVGALNTKNAKFVITGKSINELYSFEATFEGVFAGGTPIAL